jgi:hypothetical protein
MENKTIDFMREVNANSEYSILEYVNNGYTEAIKFPELFVFDDDNDSEEFVTQRSLARLTKHLSLVLERVSPILADEIDKFFAEKEKQMQEKFSYAKMHVSRKTVCVYDVQISGGYNEDIMGDFIDVLQEDFEYIFEGFKIEAKW